AGGHDDVADVGQVLDPPAGAHDVTLAVALDVVGPAADIVGLDGAGDLAEREPVSDQSRRVRLDPILLDVAADRVGAGNAGAGLHLRADDPILDRAQIHDPLQVRGEVVAIFPSAPGGGFACASVRRSGAGWRAK